VPLAEAAELAVEPAELAQLSGSPAADRTNCFSGCDQSWTRLLLRTADSLCAFQEWDSSSDAVGRLLQFFELSICNLSFIR